MLNDNDCLELRYRVSKETKQIGAFKTEYVETNFLIWKNEKQN